MILHDFPWPFEVFQDLRFSCHFQTLSYGIFGRCTDQQTQPLESTKISAVCAGDYSSLSYIVLAFSSAVTYLSNKTLIFHDFPGPTIKLHDFPGFPWPVQTPELQRECRARGLSDEGFKKQLQSILKKHLGGVQRAPAMLLNNQGRSIENLHLDKFTGYVHAVNSNKLKYIL